MKTYIPNTIEAITDHLNQMDNSELINVHNTYCQNCNYDDEIFNNDEDFFETFFTGRVSDAVRAVNYGEYSYTHDYVKFDGYGNLESFNNPSKHIGLSAIAADILENPENYDIELEEEEN